jgi:hypothetical protein
MAGAVVGGALDFHYYSVWFASPVRWFITNIWLGKSSEFGSASNLFYVNTLFLGDPATALILACGFAGLLLDLYRTWSKLHERSRSTRFMLFAISIVTLVALSSVGHKEPRYEHIFTTLL